MCRGPVQWLANKTNVCQECLSVDSRSFVHKESFLYPVPYGKGFGRTLITSSPSPPEHHALLTEGGGDTQGRHQYMREVDIWGSQTDRNPIFVFFTFLIQSDLIYSPAQLVSA